MRGAFSFIWARTDISVRYAHITVFHSAVDFCIILSKGGITISIQENLAASIRFMMEVRRQSLTEISEKAEISRSMMQEYVKARGNPSLATIEHLAEKLDVDPTALLTGMLGMEQTECALPLLGVIQQVAELDQEQRIRFAELFLEMVQILSKNG